VATEVELLEQILDVLKDVRRLLKTEAGDSVHEKIDAEVDAIKQDVQKIKHRFANGYGRSGGIKHRNRREV
jgi:hypothetical protein